MGDRTILHSDMNSFYASVEMLHHPEFAGMPLAVGGDPEARHGIVLTANYIAKRKGVKTGMALWQAKQICPEIIFVPPRMDLYLRFSQMAREIYSEYTDKIEPYGIDEAWLDVSDSRNLKGSGMTIAREISHRIKYELGVTVSIGISWNKIYAKLGSDYKKPDAITEFNRENYKSMIWQLPASDLLWTLVHIQFIHTVIFMDNGRDRFETDINQKTGRKLSVHFELYEGAWISADSSGIWKTDRSKINVICFFQN